jgi:hypothetical protein
VVKSVSSRFGADLAATGGVLWDPVATFRNLGGRSPVLAPWLVVSLLSMALALLTISVSQRAATHLLGGEGAVTEEVVRSLEHAKLFSVAAAPLSVLVQWTFVAGLLWAFAVWWVPGVHYRALLGIVAYSALPGVLEQGLDLYVAWQEGPEFTAGLVPVFTRASSLGALVPSLPAGWASAFADRVTFFGIWTAVLWSVGLRTHFGGKWRGAIGTAAPAWALLWILTATADLLGRSLAGETWTGG